MKAIYQAGLFMLCIVFLGTSCVSKKKFDELSMEKDALAQSMEEMRTDLENQINGLKDENKSLSDANSSMKSDLSNVQGELSSTKDKMADMEVDMKDYESQMNNLRNELGAAFQDVESAVSQSNQKIKDLESFLYLDIADPVNFNTASSNVSADDKESLMQLAEMMKENPNLTLLVEGHADKRSINNDKYSDNWDLSVARSTNVVRALIDMGVNPEQLVASGRAEFMPAVTDDPDSKETLGANRRMEFIVVPNVGRLYKVYQEDKKNKS